MCGHPFIKWNLLFFFLLAVVGLFKLQVVLLKMAPGGQVQRKWSGYFTQVMYADRTEAPERGSYETALLVPPPSWSFLFFFPLLPSLSQGMGYMSLAVRTLGSDHIWHFWDVYAKKRGWGRGNNQNTLNISFWIHTLPDTSISDTRTRRSCPDK